MKIVLVSLDWDLVDLIEMCSQFELIGVIDNLLPESVSCIKILGNDSEWQELKEKNKDLKVIFALDPPKLKMKLLEIYGEESIVGIISPLAHVSQRAFVHKSAIVQHGVKIMPLARVGKYCKLNINATIHHESIIGDYATVAPGAQILGHVKIGQSVYVGAGAIIRQRITVGDGAFIGAGAVVVSDIAPGTKVVGVPAKRNLAIV